MICVSSEGFKPVIGFRHRRFCVICMTQMLCSLPRFKSAIDYLRSDSHGFWTHDSEHMARLDPCRVRKWKDFSVLWMSLSLILFWSLWFLVRNSSLTPVSRSCRQFSRRYHELLWEHKILRLNFYIYVVVNSKNGQCEHSLIWSKLIKYKLEKLNINFFFMLRVNLGITNWYFFLECLKITVIKLRVLLKVHFK